MNTEQQVGQSSKRRHILCSAGHDNQTYPGHNKLIRSIRQENICSEKTSDRSFQCESFSLQMIGLTCWFSDKQMHVGASTQASYVYKVHNDMAPMLRKATGQRLAVHTVRQNEASQQMDTLQVCERSSGTPMKMRRAQSARHGLHVHSSLCFDVMWLAQRCRQ